MWTGLVENSVARTNVNKWKDFPRLECSKNDDKCLVYYEGMNALTAKYIKLRNDEIFFRQSNNTADDNKTCPQPCRRTRVGIIHADFPGKELIVQIINANGQVVNSDGEHTTIIETSRNISPQAHLANEAYTTKVDVPISIRATASNDNEGLVKGYYWELSGDQVEEACTELLPNTTILLVWSMV